MNLRYVGEKTEYPIEFSRLSDHVVSLKGDMPAKTKGFELVRDKYGDAWDYKGYTTIYRQLEGIVQYSDDGSVWQEDEKDFLISVTWDDENDHDELRPDEVTVSVFKGNEALEDIVLNEANQWKKVYHDVVSADYTVQTEVVEEYTETINGLAISYYHEVHHIPEPSMEERVTDLEAAVCELSDIVGTL